MADLVGLVVNQINEVGQSSDNNYGDSSKTGMVCLLVIATFVYFVLMFVLLSVFAELKKERSERMMYCQQITMEEKQAGLANLSNFCFLQASLLCRLVTCALILIHVTGLIQSSDSQLPVFALRIFYYLSVVFFYVACSLNIYEWLLIIHRVNFFGGLISRRDYKQHAKINRLVYSTIAGVVGGINIIIIFVNAFMPAKETSAALIMTLTVVFSALLVISMVVGTVLIHRLGLFFKKNYDKQRFSLMTALLLIVLSFLILAARYGLEYSYIEKNLIVITASDISIESSNMSLSLLIAFLIVSDFGPIIAQMYCMWLAKTGKWDDLISDYLQAPYNDESTIVGPEMLEGLKDEIKRDRFRSELLDSEQLTHGSECDMPQDLFSTSFLTVRDSFANELKQCDDTDSIKRGGSIHSFA